MTTTGKAFWRTLDELAEDPTFRQRLYREFPTEVETITDPSTRRTFLKLMGASLALAGVTACTRQPDEAIVPYVRQPEDLIPGKPLFFATAVSSPASSSRATRGGRRRSRGTPCTRPAWAQPTSLRRLKSSASTIPIAPAR